MKKTLLLLLCLTLILSLAACGGQEKAPAETEAPEETVEPTAEPTPEPTEEPAEETPADDASATDTLEEAPASGSDAVYTEPTYLTDLEPTPEAEDEDEEEPVLDDAAYEAAMAFVGRPVEELYEAIGEPTGGSLYAASCLEDGAEDGMLYYDGFYVWTVKNGSGETVHNVDLLH